MKIEVIHLLSLTLAISTQIWYVPTTIFESNRFLVEESEKLKFMLKKCTEDLENQGHSPIIVNLGDFYPNTARSNNIIFESNRFRVEESEKLKFMLKKCMEDLENQGHSPIIVNLGDFFPNTARSNNIIVESNRFRVEESEKLKFMLKKCMEDLENQGHSPIIVNLGDFYPNTARSNNIIFESNRFRVEESEKLKFMLKKCTEDLENQGHSPIIVNLGDFYPNTARSNNIIVESNRFRVEESEKLKFMLKKCMEDLENQGHSPIIVNLGDFYPNMVCSHYIIVESNRFCVEESEKLKFMLKKCMEDLENQGHSPIIVNLGDFYPNTARSNNIIVESNRFRVEESEKLKFMLKKCMEDLENQGHSPIIVNLGDFYPNTARSNNIIFESNRFRVEESEKLKFMLKKCTEDLENQGHSPIIVNLGDFHPNTARSHYFIVESN